MVLANVLPGLREVRAPLAAGYLWLLFIYLLCGIPDTADAPRFVERIASLGGALSQVGVAVVVSFAAYLLGSFVHQVLCALGDGTMRALMRGGRAPVLTPRGYALLDDLISEKVSDGAVTSPEEAEQLAVEILEELDLLRTRLLATDPALFGEVNRLNTEADLRLAVSIPLAAVACVAAVDLSLVILVPILLVTEFLLVHGVMTRRNANDKLIDALFLERIQSPVIERWERETIRP
jgi:hypothetical protein